MYLPTLVAPPLPPAVAAQAIIGLRQVIARDLHHLAHMRRRRIGSQCAPHAAHIMRRIAEGEAMLHELREGA